MITLQNVSKSYPLYDTHFDRLKEALDPFRRKFHRDFHALKDIGFSVERGETVGIVGANGSGKSTLLQIIAGTLTPTTGTVEIGGRVSALLELGAGFNPEFTGLENVYLSGAIIGLTRSEVDEKIDKILAFAEIGAFIHQPMKTYSSGMYVRLAFSVYANLDPEIFIVDEALAVGDAYFVHRCMLRFHEMQEQGCTILLVSHDASSVKRLCKKALWLQEGRMKAIGESSPVVDQYLDHVFKLQRNYGEQRQAMPSAEKIKADDSGLETTIPNCDERLGDQTMQILGVGLYNQDRKRISSVDTDNTIIVRMSVTNRSRTAPSPLLIGYIFRDAKGVEIASTHNRMEGVILPWIHVGENYTLEMKIDLPFLYPGTYSISPSFAIVEEGGDQICDRIVNALIFQVTCDKEIHVLMRFKTEFILEKAS